MNLTKQQKLDILSKAIDEGASIDVNYHRTIEEKDAKSVIEEAGGITGLPTLHFETEKYQWYKIETTGFNIAAFYEKEPIAK